MSDVDAQRMAMLPVHCYWVSVSMRTRGRTVKLEVAGRIEGIQRVAINLAVEFSAGRASEVVSLTGVLTLRAIILGQGKQGLQQSKRARTYSPINVNMPQTERTDDRCTRHQPPGRRRTVEEHLVSTKHGEG